MSYKSVEEQFWTDPKVKKLTIQEGWLFLYLITNPHAHYSGVYYISIATIASETKLGVEGVRRGLEALAKGLLVKYAHDFQMVWVINMAKHQLGNIKNTDNKFKGIENHFLKLHNCTLIQDFLRYYKEYPIKLEAPPKPLLSPSEAPSGTETENREQKQRTEDKDYAVSCEKATAQLPTPKPLKIEFGVQGFENITGKHKELWHKAYPAIDLDTEIAKMEAWVVANPKNRKSNWHKFICNWLSHSQDKAPGTKKTTWKDVEAREKELEKKKHEANKPIPNLAPLAKEIKTKLAVPCEKYEKKAEDCTNPKKVDCKSPYCKATCRFRGIGTEVQKREGQHANQSIESLPGY